MYALEKLSKLLDMAYNVVDHEMKMALYVHDWAILFGVSDFFANPSNHIIRKEIKKLIDKAYKWINNKEANSTYKVTKYWTEQYYKSDYAKRRKIIHLCIVVVINELTYTP